MRRELSARTGTAVLLWCSVPPEYVGAGTIVAAALDRLGVQEPEALAELPIDRILKILVALCVTEPRRAVRWRKLVRMGGGTSRWLHLRRGSAMAGHQRKLGV